MSDARASIDAAWRDGVGPEERAALDELAHEVSGELAVFAALCRLLAGKRAVVPVACGEPARDAVRAAALALDAALSREPASIERAMTTLVAALERVDARDPRARAAQAWADVALAEIALVVGDLRVAGQRFSALAAAETPVALRIIAMLQLAALAIERCDLEAARTWAGKAIAASEAGARPRQRAQARRIAALLDHACGDVMAMREHVDDDHVGRMLLAMLEPAPRAMTLLAEAVRVAVEHRDVTSYALCVLIGARRYVAIGRREDAKAILEAASTNLANLAPHLMNLLDAESQSWALT